MPAAKFQPPLRRVDTLVRARLVDALQEHVDRKLQIVIAPAGFGKTTLLTDFVTDVATPACWLTLDQSDADLGTFLESLIASLRRRFPEFGTATLEALQRSPDIERRVNALARTLAVEIENDLYGLALLVLDDFHEVNDSVHVTGFVDELLRLAPDNLRIVLAGRTLPNLTVSRLIVAGDLFGLGEADLKFTADELLTLLRRLKGPDITPDQVAAVANGAEGWIAGFLLSVPGLWAGLVGGLIAARGEDGLLYDYLAAEAFDRQPAALQKFLLASSTVETPDAGLCAMLLGDGDWRSMLDAAEGAGLFVTRLRDGAGAFRYHQLFRGFLQTRLRRTGPAEYARLHGVAARVFAERGAMRESLLHFDEAGEPHEAAALLARLAPGLERRGQRRLLVVSVAALPAAVGAIYPGLLIIAARSALVAGDLTRAERLVEALKQSYAAGADRAVGAWWRACAGNLRRMQGRTREALDLLREAADSAEDEQVAAYARRHMGSCLVVQGAFAEAAEQLRAALTYLNRSGEEHEAALAEFALGVALAKAGSLAEAAAWYESSLGRWRQLGDIGMEAELLNCVGVASADRGDYTRARAALEEGLDKARTVGYARTEGATQHSLGDILLAAGDAEGAGTAFERGLALMQETGELWMVTQLYEGLALAAAQQGQFATAEQHAHHAVSLAQRQESAYLEGRCRATLGAVQLRGGSRAGVTTLHTAVEQLSRLGAARELVRAYTWLAQAALARGDSSDALSGLRTALGRAEQLGSDAVFDLHARWDPGLFERALAAGIEPERMAPILDRVRRDPPPAAYIAPMMLPALAARGFGPGTVLVDGEREADWTWDKARELFFLLLHGGPRRMEQIVATLWPDTPFAKAKVAFHTAVYRLRRFIHREAVVRRDGVYRINDEVITFYDVREFEALTRDLGAPAGEESVARLLRAAELYTGPFLEDIDSPWCADERARLERQLVQTLERLSAVLTATGRMEESIAVDQRLLGLNPLREEVHARIIRAHLRMGDRAEALRQFELCEALLRDELGVRPGPRLQALARRIGV